MDEREILRLAAVAAEVPGKILEVEFVSGLLYVLTPDARRWQPGNDSGDALHLATKLKIDIEWHEDIVWAISDQFLEHQLYEWHGGNTDKAVRRAILKVAAKIGAEIEKRNQNG